MRAASLMEMTRRIKKAEAFSENDYVYIYMARNERKQNLSQVEWAVSDLKGIGTDKVSSWEPRRAFLYFEKGGSGCGSG